MDNPYIHIDHLNITLRPNCRVRLHRFSNTVWILQYGWYSYGGNREQIGWYLIDCMNHRVVKPLEKPDTYDIYLVEDGDISVR